MPVVRRRVCARDCVYERRAPGAGPQPTDSVLQNTGGNELHENV